MLACVAILSPIRHEASVVLVVCSILSWVLMASAGVLHLFSTGVIACMLMVGLEHRKGSCKAATVGTG